MHRAPAGFEQWAAYLAIGIFLLAFALRLLPIMQYHGWDESIYLQHAERIVSGKSNYSELAFRPPLLPIIIAGGFQLWHSPYMASILIALLGASITVALFLIGKRMHSSAAGLFAALLVAVHPLFVAYSHLVLTDALVASILAFALFFALDNRWWTLVVSGILTALAGLTKFTGLGAAFPLLLLIMFNAWRSRKRRATPAWALRSTLIAAAAYCGGFALAMLPYLAWAQQQYESFLVVFERAEAIVNNVSGGTLHYLSLQLFTVPLLLGIVLLVWQWSREWRGRTQAKGRRKAMLAKAANTAGGWRMAYAVFAMLWLLMILGYVNTFPNKELRYGLAPIMPLFVLAGAGYADALLRVRWRYAGAAAAAVILVLSAGAFTQLQGPLVNHWKPAAVEMAERVDALNTSMPLYATSDYPVYGYYARNQVVVIDGPAFLNAYPRIMPRDGYLVVYKQSFREPTVGWADSQEALTRIAENEEIILYEYRRSLAR